MRIVHIMIFEKFIRSYIEFIDENFKIEEHSFLIIGKDYKKYDLTNLPNFYFINSLQKVPNLLFKLYTGNKIIIHGLWDKRFIKILLMQPWLISKCFWMMWGGDFYNYENETPEKKKLIKKLRHFISFVKGDFEFVQEKYHAKGIFHESILYPVTFYEDFVDSDVENSDNKISILVGNSADPSNNHVEIFHLLEKYKDFPVEIFAPLSYGDSDYAHQVEKKGQEIFGNKFNALKTMMPLDEYKHFLKRIDIGIFNHNRQQGTGNMIPLLIGGKKLFMKKDVTTWNLFKDLGIKVFDIQELDLSRLNEVDAINNQEKMKTFFSRETYINRLNEIFNYQRF